MNELLARLLGLGDLRLGDESVQFAFARPIPAWGWLLVIGAALALAVWSYSRLVGPRWGRWTLAGLRGLLLIALVFLISGPQLVRPNDRVERDWVLVLVDRSASMTLPDVDDGGRRIAREEQLSRAIRGAWPMWSSLAADRNVVWLGFDRGAFDLRAGSDSGPPDLRRPEGRGTNLGAALDAALRRAAARPVSGVVILSDGRSVDEPSRAALRRLAAEHIPVVTIPLGSPDPLGDVAVESAEGPAIAFINDTVPVRVRLERIGGDAAPREGRVRLIDKATGLTLDEQALPAGERPEITLRARPAEAGRATWVVRVDPVGPDLIEANNRAELAVELVDRPLRVAYFDGYPRWEYRYLKNLLVREESISSSILLLAANRRFLQEGDVVMPALPRRAEDWAAYDVVVMGDVRPEMFSREQQEQLREHVAVRGAGLLWIAGPGATPAAWAEHPLAELLPFRMGSGVGRVAVAAYGEPVTMSRTDLAERLGVLELAEAGDQDGWPDALVDPETGWSRLHWAQRIDAASLKPTTEVLATASPISAPAGSAEATPLVLSMRYGAGRVLYVGTDETWRWRYARGEALPERFWLPLLRVQGRESLARSSQPAALEVSPRRPLVEQPVRIALRLLDQALVDQRLPAVTARVERRSDDDEEVTAPVELKLALEDEGGPRAVTQTYAAAWLPTEPGRYTVRIVEPTLAGLGLAATLDAAHADDELRRPEADHALLARLSEETGGRVLPVASIGELPRLLPERDLRIAGTPDVETLWDTPLALALLIMLLTFEWVGRKLIQLA